MFKKLSTSFFRFSYKTGVVLVSKSHIFILSICYQESLVHLYHKWDSIDPDAWCKIIYLEKDKVVQKFYILEREVTIDGKVGSEFDGERYEISIP